MTTTAPTPTRPRDYADDIADKVLKLGAHRIEEKSNGDLVIDPGDLDLMLSLAARDGYILALGLRAVVTA